MEKQHILVVDDEEDICEILKFNLEGAGYVVETANSAEEALGLDLSVFSLLILDIMMGRISGLRMAEMVHDNVKLSFLPIIFITAKDTEKDMITGFNIGADDYISKPFSIREVIARVNAVLRRSSGAKEKYDNDVITFDNFTLDVAKKSVMLDDEKIILTRIEFELLKLFVSNKGQVFSRDDILRKVWTDEVCVTERTVDVNITRLRKKLGSFGGKIVTRLGFGYCFEP